MPLIRSAIRNRFAGSPGATPSRGERRALSHAGKRTVARQERPFSTRTPGPGPRRTRRGGPTVERDRPGRGPAQPHPRGDRRLARPPGPRAPRGRRPGGRRDHGPRRSPPGWGPARTPAAGLGGRPATAQLDVRGADPRAHIMTARRRGLRATRPHVEAAELVCAVHLLKTVTVPAVLPVA